MTLLVALVGLPCALEGQVGQEALKGLRTGPKVTVSVSQRSHAVTAAVDIYVQVANLTESDVYIKKVEVLMPGEFVSAREAKDWTNPSTDLSDQHLKPGYQRLVPFAIPHQQLKLLTPLFNRRLLAFVPADYDLRAVVSYQIPPEPQAQVIEVAKITLQPPLSSLIWGGVLGAVLLAVFVSVYRFLRQSPQGHKDLWNAMKGAVGISAGGAVSAIIALLLLQRLKGLELPINLTVTDFYGGLVVGLFSYKIGDWLYKELSGESTLDTRTNPGASIEKKV